MKGNIDIKPHIILMVGSSIVGDVEVIVYEVPNANSLVWVILIALVVLSVAGGVGVGLGFRKQLHVWDTGHTIIVKSE